MQNVQNVIKVREMLREGASCVVEGMLVMSVMDVYVRYVRIYVGSILGFGGLAKECSSSCFPLHHHSTTNH